MSTPGDPMGWCQFVMDLESLELSRVEALFAKHGALAVTLRDARDEPVLEPAPGETPLWRHTSISALFDADVDLDALEDDMRIALGRERLPTSRVEKLADRAWEREWLEDFRPMRFGRRLWVSPQGIEPPANAAVILRLDPGLAFGTGTHPTTALCLEWLESLRLDGAEVLDLGCGSGILAIAALLLGASSATAVDIDRQAIAATGQNASANGVDDRLTTANSMNEVTATFDCAIANVLAEPLIDLAPTLTDRLRRGGRLALSGIVSHQADRVIAAYAASIEFEPPRLRDGWACLIGARR